MVTWKVIFIIITSVLIYFSYGIAAHGGPQTFFVGVITGSIATWLFTRAKAEAQANHNTNTQNVNVSLNQHKVNVAGKRYTEQEYLAIAEIVNSVVENKLLVEQRAPIELNGSGIIQDGRELPQRELTKSEQIAEVLRRMGRNA